MTTFEIRDAKPWHVGSMVRIMRREQRDLTLGRGLDPHRELKARYDDSAFRKAWMINGRLAALGGLTNSSMSSSGQIWLAVSESATHFPKAMVIEARTQLAKLLRTKRELVTTIAPDDPAAYRFARFLGFEHVASDDVLNSPLLLMRLVRGSAQPLTRRQFLRMTDA